LKKGYKTTNEEDESLLQMSSITKVTRAAIAVRKREKELIESVLAYLADRRANLENLPHQIEAIKEKERLRIKAKKDLEIWKKKVAKEESKPKPVIEFPIDLGGGNKPNFTVYEGQDLEQVAMFFAQTNGLTDAGLKSVIANARKRVKRSAKLEFFTSIVLAEGLKAGIRVFEGENVTMVVRRFCALHNLTDHQTNLTEIAVREKYKKRLNRTVLLSFPVTVPDGRSVNVDVRQGEQHDLVTHITDLTLAMKLNIDVMQLANVAHQRLKPVLVQIPISMPGKRPLQLNYRQGDEPKEMVDAFCEYYGIPVENTPQLLTGILRGIYPEAVVVPFDPNKNYTTTDEVNQKLAAAGRL